MVATCDVVYEKLFVLLDGVFGVDAGVRRKEGDHVVGPVVEPDKTFNNRPAQRSGSEQ